MNLQLRKNASDARNMTLDELIARCITGENGTMAQAMAEKCEEMRDLFEALDKFARYSWSYSQNLEYQLNGIVDEIDHHIVNAKTVDEDTLAQWAKDLLEDKGSYEPDDADDTSLDWKEHLTHHRTPKTLDDYTTEWLMKHNPKLQ